MGLSEKTATNGGEREQQEEEGDGGDPELQNNLRQLEEEVRSFKEKTKNMPKKPERRSLYSAFTNKLSPVSISSPPRGKDENARREQQVKALSPDTLALVEYFYEKGYFKEANFAKGKERFDPAWFEKLHALCFIKCASKNFARDNQEIAKWLSGSALKQVAMFGCPSSDRGDVFPAKRLRKFFEVPENTVCSKCTLQQSCMFANQTVWKCDTNTLDLGIVMKVITSYALESVHPQLVVPDEVKKSVNQLLKEVVKLSQTT